MVESILAESVVYYACLLSELSSLICPYIAFNRFGGQFHCFGSKL